jgi:hypothetical protein
MSRFYHIYNIPDFLVRAKKLYIFNAATSNAAVKRTIPITKPARTPPTTGSRKRLGGES